MRLIDTFVTLSFFIPLINSVRSPLEDVAQSRLQLKSLDRISSPKCFDFSFGDSSFPQRTAIFLPILSASWSSNPFTVECRERGRGVTEKANYRSRSGNGRSGLAVSWEEGITMTAWPAPDLSFWRLTGLFTCEVRYLKG